MLTAEQIMGITMSSQNAEADGHVEIYIQSWMMANEETIPEVEGDHALFQIEGILGRVLMKAHAAFPGGLHEYAHIIRGDLCLTCGLHWDCLDCHRASNLRNDDGGPAVLLYVPSDQVDLWARRARQWIRETREEISRYEVAVPGMRS